MEKNEALENLNTELKSVMLSKSRRRTFLKMAPLLLASCASVDQHRYREGDQSGRTTSLTVEDEIKMTEEYLPEMKKEYPLHHNREAQAYIQELGQEIVRENNLHGSPYQYNFSIVETEQINAFALPAGTVMVTAPLLTMAETEAELAGVIGHEIGHVQARHTAHRIDKAKKSQRKSLLYGLGGALLGGAAGFGISRLVCSDDDRECMRRIAAYGAAAGAAGGLMIQQFAFMAHSREDEMEADRIGFRVSHKAGYHKDHVGKFYEKLLEMEREFQSNQSSAFAPLTDAMSTHPPSQERVDQMRAMSREVSNGANKISSPKFERIKKILS